MDNFSNEKILLVAKETYCYPFWFMIPRLKENNQIGAFFINYGESRYNKCRWNEATYYLYKTDKDLAIFDLNPEIQEFSNTYKSPTVDYEFLENIERDICKDVGTVKNLNTQAVGCQQLSRFYHYRGYVKDLSYHQRMKLMEIFYKGALRVLDNFKPTLILDMDTSEMSRNALYELSKLKGIPYIVVESSRVDTYKIPSYTLGYGDEDYFKEIYNKYFTGNDENIKDEIQYVRKYRNKDAIMSEEFQNTITADYDTPSFLDIFKHLYTAGINIINQIVTNGKVIHSIPFLYPNPRGVFSFFAKREVKRKYLLGKNKYFKDPVPEEKYVYFPLAMIPEASTTVKAPMYVNDLFIIEEVSKALPVGWKLYVKEHQSMIGERDVSFYKKVNRLPNCKMVRLNYYRDPKPWIVNSMGVITVTGTSSYEAALLGKKSILLGDVFFDVIEGITRIRSFEDLQKAIFDFAVPMKDNTKSSASYVAAVKEIGEEVNIEYLMSEGEFLARSGKPADEKYSNEIEKLAKLFYKSYKLWRLRTTPSDT